MRQIGFPGHRPNGVVCGVVRTFNPGMLNGVFASVQNSIFNNGTEKWVVIYNNSGGYVELQAQANGQPTPEPASFLMLGTGLLGLSYGRRRNFLK